MHSPSLWFYPYFASFSSFWVRDFSLRTRLPEVKTGHLAPPTGSGLRSMLRHENPSALLGPSNHQGVGWFFQGKLCTTLCNPKIVTNRFCQYVVVDVVVFLFSVRHQMFLHKFLCLGVDIDDNAYHIWMWKHCDIGYNIWTIFDLCFVFVRDVRNSVM